MKEVTVYWKDSNAFGGVWYDEEEIEEFDAESCVTKGWIVREDKNEIVVAQTKGRVRYLNLIVIPKGAITKIET